MSTLNYLCKNDVSDEDCYRCSKHGVKFACPSNCKDFEDVRDDMSDEMLAERTRYMEVLGIKDPIPYRRKRDERTRTDI